MNSTTAVTTKMSAWFAEVSMPPSLLGLSELFDEMDVNGMIMWIIVKLIKIYRGLNFV